MTDRLCECRMSSDIDTMDHDQLRRRNGRRKDSQRMQHGNLQWKDQELKVREWGGKRFHEEESDVDSILCCY